MKESVAKYEKREKDRAKQEEKKIAALEKKIQHLEIAGAGAVGAAGATKVQKCIFSLRNLDHFYTGCLPRS